MTATEHIYYGFGQIIYSLAFADGDIQPSEKQKLEEIVSQELKERESIQVTSIIFKLLESDKLTSAQTAYEHGIKNIKLGDNHLTSEMVNMFNNILTKVAIAFPPETKEEKQIITNFKNTFNNFK